jgi:hypothetical protein
VAVAAVEVIVILQVVVGVEAPVWVFFRRSRPQVSSGDSKASLEIRRGEELLATSELKPADDSSGTLVPYLAMLSLKNLIPGRYELIAKVEEGVEATRKSVFGAKSSISFPGKVTHRGGNLHHPGDSFSVECRASGRPRPCAATACK